MVTTHSKKSTHSQRKSSGVIATHLKKTPHSRKVKQAEPSVACVQKMKELDMLTITSDDDRAEVIKAGDQCILFYYSNPPPLLINPISIHSIYVAPEGLDLTKRPHPGDAYWKMEVVSIHEDQGKCWVVGSWFYSPSNVRKLNNLNAR